MVREGLLMPIRSAMQKARKQNQSIRVEAVPVRANGQSRLVNLQVFPLRTLKQRCFLIFFEPLPLPSEGRGKKVGAKVVADRSARRGAAAENMELRNELAAVKSYLQGITEQYEAVNEELQAANEEAQSSNEELQSINEELET